MQIDDDIPPPPPQVSKYPFRQMRVGDSFAVLAPGGKHVPLAVAAAHNFGHRNGWKFRTRREGRLVRIWRVA